MKSSHELQARIDQENTIVESILAVCQTEEREPSAEEQSTIDAKYGVGDEPGLISTLQKQLKSRIAIENKQKEIAAQKLGSTIQRKEAILSATNVVPAVAKRHGTLKAFANTAEGERDAYIAGKWFMARILNHKGSERWLREHGLFAQQEETAGQGLELVPEPLEASILRRLDMISSWTQKVRTSVMTSATLKIPDRLAGVTVYYPDENTAITPSHMTLAQQLLTTRKLATLTQVGSELTEDSVISVMDMLADDIAYEISKKNEQDCFLGDGTATYGGVTGLAGSIGANSTVTGAGATASAFTLANYEACVALNPFFQGSMPEWYCSSAVYASSMLPLQFAQGGSSGQELGSGFQRSFMGFPVNIVQSMDKGSTASTDQVYFGDLSQSVYYGVRRGMNIATSTDYGFNTDSIYIRGTMRNAITVDNHDTSAAGPITAIATTA